MPNECDAAKYSFLVVIKLVWQRLDHVHWSYNHFLCYFQTSTYVAPPQEAFLWSTHNIKHNTSSMFQVPFLAKFQVYLVKRLGEGLLNVNMSIPFQFQIGGITENSHVNGFRVRH